MSAKYQTFSGMLNHAGIVCFRVLKKVANTRTNERIRNKKWKIALTSIFLLQRFGIVKFPSIRLLFGGDGPREDG